MATTIGNKANEIGDIANGLFPGHSVRYAGKIIPQDAAEKGFPPADNVVNYSGSVLPKDKVAYQKPIVDPTNNPSLVILTVADTSVQFPPDVAIYVDGKKIIAKSQIIDAVVVYERIMRAPYEVEFEMTVRQTEPNSNSKYIFPQDAVANIWQNVWLPDTVVKVANTYLNRLGIFQLVIESVSPATVRGSTDVPMRIKCYENVEGESIIIS